MMVSSQNCGSSLFMFEEREIIVITAILLIVVILAILFIVVIIATLLIVVMIAILLTVVIIAFGYFRAPQSVVRL